MSSFRFIYQDESGDVGRGQDHFVVGLLLVREREPLWAAIKEARDRHCQLDDLLQLTDLLTGCVNNRLGHPARDRKQQVRHHAEALDLIHSDRIWIWKPQKETP